MEDRAAAGLALAEYRTLRATIAVRGHLRLALGAGTLAAWAALLLLVPGRVPGPLFALVPLVILVGGFEVIRSLHFGVERIGRYLQVFFEESPADVAAGPSTPMLPPAWERAVVQVGGRLPGAAGHPLFLPLFAIATLLNLLAALGPASAPVEWMPLVALHLAFVGWMLRVDRGVRAQRAHDEARFRAIRDQHLPRPPRP